MNEKLFGKKPKHYRLKKHISQTQFIAYGFFLIIMTGSLLLMLPIASRDGQSEPFLNCLFTATSASCVTGLVVADTWTQWSLFGQMVLLVLIQLGGLGFISIGIFLSIVLRRKIGLKERGLMQESVNTLQIGGFDLMGHTSQYSSLCNYEGDWVVIGTISFLIITGGIGFIVWDDLSRKKLDFRHSMLHTKIVLVTTAVLLVTSTILFYLMERNNILVGMNGSESFLACFFSAVSHPHVHRRKPGLHGRRYQDQHPGSASALRPFQYPPDIRGGDIREKAGGRVHQAVGLHPDHQPGSDAGSHHSHYGVPEPAYVGCVL